MCLMKKYKILLSLFCVVVFVFLAVGSNGNDDEPVSEPEEVGEVEEVDTPEEVDVSEEIEEKVEAEDEATTGEKNALSSALSYLDYSAFSYSGLVKQLEFEGFTNEQAVYGVDNCGADWNEQAALSAEQYLEYQSFSRDGLIDQLMFEGFTREQAEYGVEVVY
jgi:colicin import membrane protein